MAFLMMFCGGVGAAVLLALLMLGGLAGWWLRGVRDRIDRRTRSAPPSGHLPLSEDQARRMREEQKAMDQLLGYSEADAYGLTRNDSWPSDNRPPGGG